MQTLVPILIAIIGLAAAPAFGGAAATARMIDGNGAAVGRANLKSTPHGVVIEIEVTGLTPGPHAVLLHATGACDPARAFATSGPVLALDGERPHGYFAKGGPRAGDLPNQFAGSDGVLHASVFTTAISLGDGKKTIFDRDGVSIIVHAAADDYTSQPDGHAGARLACGTVMRTIAPGRTSRKKN